MSKVVSQTHEFTCSSCRRPYGRVTVSNGETPRAPNGDLDLLARVSSPNGLDWMVAVTIAANEYFDFNRYEFCDACRILLLRAAQDKIEAALREMNARAVTERDGQRAMVLEA